MIQQKAFVNTQGGADTAAETTIATLIQPGITYGAWELVGLEFTMRPTLVKAWAAADADYTLQLTKRSLTGAIVNLFTYADTDLIATWSMAAVLSGTAANLAFVDTTRYLQLPPGVIVYSENLYLHVITTGTGQTNITWGRILYNPITLTPAQAMSVIASRP